MRNGTRAARANDRGAEVDLAAVRHRHDDPAVDHLENDLHPDRALLPDLEVVDLLRTSRMEVKGVESEWSIHVELFRCIETIWSRFW